MLDIKFICENPEIVKENIKKKFEDKKLPLVDEVISLYGEKCAANNRANNLRANRNKVSKQIGMLMAQGKRDEAEEMKRLVERGELQIAYNRIRWNARTSVLEYQEVKRGNFSHGGEPCIKSASHQAGREGFDALQPAIGRFALLPQHQTKRLLYTKIVPIFGIPESVSILSSGAQCAAICCPSSRRSVSNTVPGVKWSNTMDDETSCKVAGISSGVSGRESE